MEGARLRRSKSASSFEGLPQFQKHITVSRLSPDSGSYVNASIRNDASLEIRESSFARAADRPSANLLAERICKETEPKRRFLSGIARLIRREGLPSLWSVHKQKKRLFNSYRLNSTSINIEPNRQLYDVQSNRRSPKKQEEYKDVYEDLEASSFVNGRTSSRWSARSMLEPNRQLYDVQSNRRSPKKQEESKDVYEDLEASSFVNGRCSSRWSTRSMLEPNRQLYDVQSNRRSPKKQQESKDVYEDLEASSFVNGRCSSRWSASSMLSKSEMALIQQNLDSKRLTYDEIISEKFQDSEDLDGSLDMLDSRDIMMQFGRKKNSFGNLMYDEWGTSSSSLGSPPTLLDPPNSVKYGNGKSRRADIDITGKQNINYYPNRDDGLLLDPHYQHRACSARKMSNIQSKEKNKKSTLPAPIVVLKPNLGNVKNDHGSSPYHSQNYFPNSAKMTGHPSDGSVKELSWRKTKSYYDAEFLDPVSEEARTKEARKLAKKITRRLRDACDKSEEAIYSGFRGYAAHERIFGAKESDIDNELEMFKWSSESSFIDYSKKDNHASSRSVNEEAKMRLAERWKITHKYRDLEIVGEVSTLGEMLSAPDIERRSRKTAYGHTDRSSKTVISDNGSSIQNGLLGPISSGGSKNKTERRSRSRSVPPIGGKIRGRGTCHNILDNEKHLLHSDHTSHGTSKVTKQCPSHKDHFSSQASKFNGKIRKKPLSCPPIFIEAIDSSLEARFEIQMEANVKDLPYQQLTIQMEEKDNCSAGDVPEIVAAEHGITTLLSKTSLLHPSDSSVDNESSSSTAHDEKDFCLQEIHQEVSEEGDPSMNHLGTEAVSLESSKDADYASPVSVLETPFIEDASSSSENSERVSAEVNELRMQLQLLKMESDVYDNTSAHIPIEKDSMSTEGWEAYYTLDVLIQAGLQDFGFDLFRIMWHFPECPLDTRLFDILEEKYHNVMAVSRPERMLLFDRINSALSETFLKHIDVRPWVMSKLAGSLHLTRQKERARSTVEKLIGQETANRLQVTERILDREMQWQDPREEMALTSNEIGELLIDDLINEFLFD